jgi:beta-N-acetylhexosaminidase
MKRRKKSRKWQYAAIFVFSLIIVLAAGAVVIQSMKKPAESAEMTEPLETAEIVLESKELTLDEKADRIVAKMTDGEKIGQMTIIGITGTEINEDARYMLHEFNAGGVIMFDRNMQSRQQVAELNKALQKEAGILPLFIAIDEEGGIVARMKSELEPPPSQQEIGTLDADNARQWAVKISRDLKQMGFNLNFAPVADVGSPDSRSFSDDEQIVSAFVQAAVKGYDEEKMLCSLKHFPGIGRGREDSHSDTVLVDASRDELERVDMLPFRRMIETGGDNWLVMVTHVNYPALDEENPASLSSEIMQKILRQELGYDGIIITDDLEMGAISKHYTFSQAAVKAVQAGADIVLTCHEYEHEIEVYNALLKALQNGEISKERINSSVRRIVKAKLKYLM